MTLRYFVEIENSLIHRGDSLTVKELPSLQLGPDVEITIKGKSYKLGDLVQALITYNKEDLELVFDERGQLEIGRYLYAQLFGTLSYHEHNGNEVNIRIITSDDEHVRRLPWVLLADNGIFLSTIGWSITLSSYALSRHKYKNLCECCEIPPSPRMLIVAPQPLGVASTHAELHIEDLERVLSSADHYFLIGRHMRIAYTWEEFTDLVKTFKPHIIYYYGHAEGDIHEVRLVFATGNDYQRRDVPVVDFALCLRDMPPRLIYVNCCSGDAGGFLGVGKQLEDFIPAVVTNRTVAKIDAAQAQAKVFWESVLLKGTAPHKAIATLYRQMLDLDLSVADVRWMTPVLHCHYNKWRAKPPKPSGRSDHDPHWHLKIDRITQFSTVATQTRKMLRERKLRSHAFVWYGEQGQGIELFHQRLTIELREDLSNTFIYEVRPEWPKELENPHRSFQDMMTEVFKVNYLEDIPDRIRSKTYGNFGKQTLVYIRHQPGVSPKKMTPEWLKHSLNPRTLKTYLEWWNSHMVPLLEAQQFALLGISFIVKNPPKFRSVILNNQRLGDLYLDGTIFRLLDEMESIAKRDLLEFLRTYDFQLPIKRRDKVLEDILERTGGHYEKTVEELKDLVERAWDLSEEDEVTQKELEEMFIY